MNFHRCDNKLILILMAASLVAFISGCASYNPPPPDPANTPTVSKYDTVIAMATGDPTQTPIPEPSLTATATLLPPTETPTPLPPYQQECIPIQDLPSSGLPQTGVIVLGGSQARLFNLKTLGKPAIPLTSGGANFQFLLNNSAVSPDGKEFMYVEGSPDPKGYIPMRLALRIVRSDGRRVAVSQPWDMRWNSIASWLAPEQLLLAWDVTFKGRMSLVNPFTGDGKDLEPNLPQVYQSHLPGTHWDNATNAVYSRDLSQVVYLQDDMVSPQHELVLWDVKARTVLWQRPDRGALEHTPVWSPDGSAFAVAVDLGTGNPSQDELFLVGRDGHERQLTHLASVGDKGVMRGLTWAPDGQSLALWLDYRQSADSYETEELAVLDLNRGPISLSCFGSGSARPVWSPDSMSIVFEIDPVNQPAQTILLVRWSWTAYLLAENAYPAVWLKAP